MNAKPSAIDMFAGIGGLTLSAEQAGCRVLWAGNHAPLAVQYHGVNHPAVQHACQDLHQADWRDVPRHDVLLAAPACGGHTPARGKEQPHHDAARATAWAVVSALEIHRTRLAVIENVPAFLEWTLYGAWCEALRALGYAISPHIFDAADSGVPQHRRRLFILLTRSRSPLRIELPRRAHVPAASFITFDSDGWSRIRNARRAKATLARVSAGRRAFGDRFLMPYYSRGSGLTGRALDRPIGTITTVDRWAVVDGNRMRMLSKDEYRAAMSFPAHHALPPSKADAIFLLGNAVPPKLGKAVLQQTLRAA